MSLWALEGCRGVTCVTISELQADRTAITEPEGGTAHLPENNEEPCAARTGGVGWTKQMATGHEALQATVRTWLLF